MAGSSPTAIRRLNAGIADSPGAEIREALSRIAHLRDIDVIDGATVRVHATVNGSIDEVVKLLARYRITDLTVEEPDLEESVLDLYGRQEVSS